ncbi:hypothetical protein FQA39_LY17220 [Lamprigera yunnana]|nr:hypothetical protein FQA39_LY17220 [Lamprigera yunnana]
MDKYEVIGLLGEGSFGRVYKANQVGSSSVVALKVITKRGRSLKEIKGLRQECKIQRSLHHPNIIQMLDSFETDNEIVVITEFAHKELTVVLSKEGYLSESRVQSIVWDLVSALYYLHSHRVLHRDLKPQNILLDLKNKAKLCDFGFARNMSTGTHVLTSIKGTPLYMAPELIEEHPYDHNADLWSLGCIIYELLVGTPPFCTTSLLHLIRMIKHDHVQFPTFLSEICVSFLKGLLQKDPGKRVAWPDLLKHPFVKGHVLILDDVPSKPLTRPMSDDTLQAKEQQRKDCLIQKGQKNSHETIGLDCSHDKAYGTSMSSPNKNDSSIDEHLSLLSINEGKEQSVDCKDYCDSKNLEESKVLHENLNFSENSSPIENDEWVVFLLKTIEEVISGEMASLSQLNLATIIISPLGNSNMSSKVLGCIASLMSLPFVVPDVSDDVLEQVKKTYNDIKVIPNLVHATKLLFQHKPLMSTSTSTSSIVSIEVKPASELTDEDMHALECIHVLICHLVYLNTQFLTHFCDSVIALNTHMVYRFLLLLSKRKVRIVIDLLAILTHILRTLPERANLVTRIIFNSKNMAENEEIEELNFIGLLKHSDSLLRERTCYFLRFLGTACSASLKSEWSDCTKDTLEALVYDSIEDVRNAAEVTVEHLRKLSFYDKAD